jgi:hypothetical protein
MSDSGLSDIRINFFIVGLIRYRTRGPQSDKFLSDIGLDSIGVGYRISATKIFDVAPTFVIPANGQKSNGLRNVNLLVENPTILTKGYSLDNPLTDSGSLRQ